MLFSSLLPPPKKAGLELPAIQFHKERPKLNKVLIYEGITEKEFKSIANETNNEDDFSRGNKIGQVIVNADSSLNYGLTIATAGDNERNYKANYNDTVPLKKRYPELKHYFPLPLAEDEALNQCVASTKNVINDILAAKLGLAKDKNSYNGNSNLSRDQKSEVVTLKSTSILESNSDDSTVNEDGGSGRGRTKERTVEINNFQEDPLLPPKFKIRKNKSHDTSPPPPVLKKAPAKPLTKEEQEAWKIPAAISNWKNNQGFTISLEKRILAANGGTSNSSDLNIEGFGNLTLALENADNKAREEIKARNIKLAEIALKEQKEKEDKLKELAELSRLEREKKRSADDRYSLNRNKRYRG